MGKKAIQHFCCIATFNDTLPKKLEVIYSSTTSLKRYLLLASSLGLFFYANVADNDANSSQIKAAAICSHSSSKETNGLFFEALLYQ